MKINDIYDELADIAKTIGITVRRENGNFKSGFCVVNEQKLILFNRNATVELRASVLARCLSTQSIEKMYLKPVIREYIEKEVASAENIKDFELVVKY
ncbi:MAG: hypothetical protein NT007_14770 [Candidatus Kapabacteria bacterium]|nr:hypothetical protein [Candidatus Kapabacteria bacterium]